MIAAIGASAAPAATGYQDQASIGLEAVAQRPTDVAFDPTTGNLLVSEPEPGTQSQVSVIGDPTGVPTVISGFSAGEPGQAIHGIAVDPTDGDVYVSSPTGISRYVSDGNSPPSYSLDATYTGPSGGSGPGQVGNFAAALAVDPNAGDLLVADTGNHRISRYLPSGAFVESFEGSTSGGGSSLSNPIDLTVQPNGDIDVLNLEGRINESGPITEFDGVEGTSEVDRYSPSGVLIEAVDRQLTADAVSLTFDPGTQDLLFARQTAAYGDGRPKLASFNGGAIVGEAAYSRVGGDFAPRVPALATGADGQVFALTAFGFVREGAQNSVQRFEHVTFPEVSLGALSDITATGAQVVGTVDPDSSPTEYSFESSADQGATWVPGPGGNAGEGQGASAVEGRFTNLEPNRAYLVRLRAFNEKAEAASPPLSFRTLSAPAIVHTKSVSEASSSEPELQGTVNPNGSQTRYFFEYGETTSYGFRTPAGAPLAAGQGRDAVAVASSVSGLTPGTEYHFRLVATNQGGRTFGEDRTFVAGSEVEGSRAYELVSPADKGNVGVSSFNESSLARADGNSILYGTNKAPLPGSLSGRLDPRYLATRTPNGWVTSQLDPPTITDRGEPSALFGTVAISRDQSRALVASKYRLTTGVTGGPEYLYVLDIAKGTYTFVSSVDDDWVSFASKYRLVGFSPDLREIAFATEASFIGNIQLYRDYLWTEGSGVTLLSKTPSGTPFETSAQEMPARHNNPQAVSDSGSRIYFGIGTPQQPEAGLYLSEHGQTRAVSVSHVPGAPRTPVAARLIKASADGRYAIFVNEESGAPPLTADSPSSGFREAYLYDADTGELRYLANDVSSVYSWGFPESGRLYSYSSDNGFARSLSYTEASGTVLVAGPAAGLTEQAQVSEGGRYIVFGATGDVTGYDSDGYQEFYRYDAATGVTVCVSCRTDGGRARGSARIGQAGNEAGTLQESSLQQHFPLPVRDDGTVYFDTPDPLVGRDANGVRDVYEYRAGQMHLVTPGNANTPATFVEATPDGKDVFFVTGQALVPSDEDQLEDLYDARIGGGFDENAPAESDCADQCRSGGAAPPPATGPGSESVSGGTRKPAVHRKRAKKTCHRTAKKGKRTNGGTRCQGKRQPKKHGKNQANKSRRGGAR